MNKKAAGITLVELLIAMAISSIVLTTAFITLAQIHLQQKQISFSHTFVREHQVLLHTLNEIVRQNPLDYQTFFEAKKDTDASFGSTCDEDIYEQNFFFDIGGKPTHLGGRDASGDENTCAFAWDESPQSTIYLRDPERPIRTTLRYDDVEQMLYKQVDFGLDTDNDGRADTWGNQLDWNGTTCSFDQYGITEPLVWVSDQILCSQAHTEIPMLPDSVQVMDIQFFPWPSQHPDVAFNITEAQIQPGVQILLHTYTMNESLAPDGIEFRTQTFVSSRER